MLKMGCWSFQRVISTQTRNLSLIRTKYKKKIEITVRQYWRSFITELHNEFAILEVLTSIRNLLLHSVFIYSKSFIFLSFLLILFPLIYSIKC